MTGSQNNPLTTVTSNSASFGPLLYDDHAGAVSVSSRHSFVENFVKQSIKWKICPRDLRTFYEDNRKNGDSPIASPAAQDDSPPYKPTSTLLSPNEWTCLLPPLPKHVPADAALNPLWSPRSRYRVGDYVKFRDNGNYYVYTPGGETVKDMTQQQRDKELSREAKDARRDRQAGKDRQASKDRQAAGKASKRGFGNTGNAGNKRAPATTTTMAAEAAASGYALTSSTLDSNLVYDVQTKQWVLSLKKSEFMGMSFFLSVPAHLIKHYETLFVKGVQKGVDKIIGGDGWVVKVKGFKCDETEGEEVTEGKSKVSAGRNQAGRVTRSIAPAVGSTGAEPVAQLTFPPPLTSRRRSCSSLSAFFWRRAWALTRIDWRRLRNRERWSTGGCASAPRTAGRM